MSRITGQEVQKIAMLSRLDLDEAQAQEFAGQLSSILDYVEQLNALDTAGVEPTSHALRLTNVVRPDVATGSLEREQVLANAPQAEAGCFRVPQIIQEST